MGIDDDNADVVERNATDLLAARLDGHKTALGSEMPAVFGDLDDTPDHDGGPGSRARPRTSTVIRRSRSSRSLS
jgi:hypothetical protein